MKLHMQTPHESRICPIDFEVKRSKVKVTMHKLLKNCLAGGIGPVRTDPDLVYSSMSYYFHFCTLLHKYYNTVIDPDILLYFHEFSKMKCFMLLYSNIWIVHLVHHILFIILPCLHDIQCF